MILRSIELEGWRSFVSKTSVGPFVDGLNIIHGPNGSGKSSLIMALARGLFDSHSVGGNDIQTSRSWGRELAPKVTIEFEKDDQHFQLFKQFLDSPTAKLARKENGTYVPFAESRAADDQARKLLAGEASKSGASDQRHWGLAQILWATQGSLQIDNLASGTRTTIQGALGAQITGSGTENLENQINAVYRQFFTPTGRLKSGASAPAMVGLEAQLANEKSDRADLQQRLEEFEEASKRIETLRLQTQSARKKETELENELKTTRDKVQAYQKLTAQQKQLQAEVKTSSVTYGSLVEKIDAITSAVKQHQTATIESEQLTNDLPAIKKRVEECQQAAKLADEKVKEIRSKRSEATTARQHAQLAQQHAHHLENFQEFEKQLKQIEAVEAEIVKLHETRKPIVAPDKAAMERITKVARQRDDARLKLDAAVITVGIQLDSDQVIEVTQSEETGSRSAIKDERFEIKGAPDVAFQIPGVGRFTATGPTADFKSLREQWQSAVNTLQELTADYGTSDLASLEKLSTRALELDSQISNAQVKLSTQLDGDSIEKLSADREAELASLDKIYGDHPKWKATPPVPAELSKKAEELEKRFASEIESAEQADGQAQETLQQETRKLESHQSKIATLKTQASDSDTRLAALRKDGLADELRLENRTKLAMELDVAKGNLAKVEKQVEEFGGDPADSLAALETRQEELRTEADDAEKSLHTESGRLEQIISEAPYSKLAEVEEEIARLERDIARDRLHIDAIRLLHNTVCLLYTSPSPRDS